MPRKPRYTRDEVLAAIRDSHGVVSEVARRLGCDWHTARKYIGRWRQTQEAFEVERKKLLDRAESTLVAALESDDLAVALPAAKWILSRLGRHRGYGDTVGVTTDGQPLAVTFRWVRPDGSDVADDW